MSASWRTDDAQANNFHEPQHLEAIRYCVKQALYNKALYEWRPSGASKSPQPELFGLKLRQIDDKDAKALGQIRANFEKKGIKSPL